MNNKVVFAAAGNGKTFSICKQAKIAVNSGNNCVLLISYTNEGVRSLENEYRKQNQGILDDRVVVKSWYSFLLSEFIKPYQCLLMLKIKCDKNEYPYTFTENFVTSIAFYETDSFYKYFNKTHVQYFVNENGDIVPDRTSQLAILCNEHSTGKAIARMESIYSHVFIDELQDYAGWDLEIIKLLFESQLQITCVGDYKQSTYRTNNSPKNSQYRDEKIHDFFVMLEQKELCSLSYANTTRRFNQKICDFINTIYDENALISPEPTMEQETQPDNTGVYVVDLKYLKKYCDHYHPVILRYNKNTNIGFQYDYDVFNYGSTKGATYERTVIVPVSTTLPFIKEQKKISSVQTRSKFYVACTRARYSIVIAMDMPKENDVFKVSELKIGGDVIPALQFIKV